MTRLLPYGDRAVLVEMDDGTQVPAWTQALRQPSDPALAVLIGDVVAGARTVLVVAADGVAVPPLRDALRRLDPAPVLAPDGAAPTVELPVVYDGPDLVEVSRLTGMSITDVIAHHCAQTWRVAFGGFAPGFGYLIGEDDRLRVPRRATARTSVPAGAVGLAEEYSGVYPRESPGGWQLIGRTEQVMWDLNREPPALLTPGALVRFIAVTGAP